MVLSTGFDSQLQIQSTNTMEKGSYTWLLLGIQSVLIDIHSNYEYNLNPNSETTNFPANWELDWLTQIGQIDL